MAYNTMNPILKNLGDSLRYVLNPDKTDGGLLCAGINTTPATAYVDMQETKHRYGKMDKRLGYHIVQSFKPGEITPDNALHFGMEFIEKYLGNRYEGVAAVHIDKAHVHVHIVFNSVSYVDGRKFHAAKGEYVECIRAMCDEQCRAWGLSVIEGDFTVRKTTKDEARSATQGKPSCQDMIRADIDRAVSINYTWQNFISELRRQGYEVKETKANVALKPPGMKKFVRLKSLGEGYEREDIQRRLSRNLNNIESIPTPDEIPFPRDEAIDRYIGIQADYFNILAQMRKLRERKHYRYSPALRAEIRKQEQWDEDFRFQEKYGITSIEELEKHKQDNLAVIAAITQQREDIYRERRRVATKNNPTRMSELDEELQKYKTVLAGLRRENRIAERIQHRLEEKVQAMLAAEEAQMQIEKKMKSGKQHKQNEHHYSKWR